MTTYEWRLYCLKTGDILHQGELEADSSRDAHDLIPKEAGVEHWGRKHKHPFDGTMHYAFGHDAKLTKHFGKHSIVMYEGGTAFLRKSIIESIITKDASIPTQALVVMSNW